MPRYFHSLQSLGGFLGCLFAILLSFSTSGVLSFSLHPAVPSPRPGHAEEAHIRLRSYRDDHDTSNTRMDRRVALNSMMLSLTTLVSVASSSSAYDKTYPEYLEGREDSNLQMLRQAKIAQQKKETTTSSSNVKQLSTDVLWGGALWFLSGSRSNPLATPLANLIYDETKEDWLKDRNEGFFAPFPLPFSLLLACVFLCLGVVADALIHLAADGSSSNISLQLAGVSLIAGGSLELGRIASGEKKLNREDFDREAQLQQEFEEFAEERLQLGGNCHRSDVVRAFRRYYAKYRQEDSEEYPLTNLEIEQLLRSWSRRNPRTIEMSSAGFYSGIQINEQADVFVSR